MIGIQGSPWVPGVAEGPLLPLAAPLSLWGGVDPETGRVTDPRHPDAGRSLAGRIVAFPATVGSSSSSAVLLELIRHGVAPHGIVLPKGDAILALGSLVARELGYRPVPILVASPESWAAIPAGTVVRLDPVPGGTGSAPT